MASGWIKLHRKLMDSPMWTSEPFTKGQAWVDLLMLAQYEDNENFKRGCVYKSKKQLAKRWRWSEGKVTRFLNGAENGASIRAVNRALNGTVIIIENFDFYQHGGAANGAANGATNSNTNSNQYKNIKNTVGGALKAPSSSRDDPYTSKRVKIDGEWVVVENDER